MFRQRKEFWATFFSEFTFFSLLSRIGLLPRVNGSIPLKLAARRVGRTSKNQLESDLIVQCRGCYMSGHRFEFSLGMHPHWEVLISTSFGLGSFYRMQ
jgi:hypothetical protein